MIDAPPGAIDADRLLRERGTAQALGAHVVAACFGADDRQAAFALGDGGLHLAPCMAGAAWRAVRAHEGGILALTPDVVGASFLTGGDDGLFRRTGADGAAATLVDFKGKWVESVAGFAHPKQGLLACAAGREAHLFSAQGERLRGWGHPSTVTGLAFDARGKRLGASHYNGASLWFVNSDAAPRRLEWKGSHIGIAIHPGNEAVVTSMQENALHGWRLADSQHMRMSGYPAKVESIAFTRKGRWLASSGAEAVVLWPFFAGGPMNKPPLELAPHAAPCTRVAANPGREMVAAGYADGMVLLADLAPEAGGRILPVAAPDAGRGAVTALAWSHGGGRLAFGTERGFAAWIDLSG